MARYFWWNIEAGKVRFVSSTSEVRGQDGLCQTLASYTDTMMTASAGRRKKREENEQDNIIIPKIIHNNPSSTLDWSWIKQHFSVQPFLNVFKITFGLPIISQIISHAGWYLSRCSLKFEKVIVYDGTEKGGLGREGGEKGGSAVISRATDYNWPSHILSNSYLSFHSSQMWSGCVIIFQLFWNVDFEIESNVNLPCQILSFSVSSFYFRASENGQDVW